MYILRFEVKQHVSALYGHHQVFSFPLRFRYIICDVEISHPIIIPVCLCIGGYYITLIYIYSLSVGRGVGGFILGVSAGCQPPLLQGVAVTRLPSHLSSSPTKRGWHSLKFKKTFAVILPWVRLKGSSRNQHGLPQYLGQCCTNISHHTHATCVTQFLVPVSHFQ